MLSRKKWSAELFRYKLFTRDSCNISNIFFHIILVHDSLLFHE